MIGEITLKAPRAATGGGMNPARRQMRKHEREAERRIATALGKLRRDVTRGMNEQNARFITTRLVQRDVIQPFTDVIVDVLRDIALDGAEHGRKQVERFVFGVKREGSFDIDWELANADAERWARQYGYNLVGGITDTTRNRLQAEISEWVTNQETVNQLAKRLARPNGPFGQTRAKTIAVTETTRAFAEGNRSAWRESGVIQKRRWNTSVDELVCPICGPLHNTVVGLEESFPGGLDNAPAHPNCRCWVTPVVEGAEDRDTGLEQYGLVQQGAGHVDKPIVTLSESLIVVEDKIRGQEYETAAIIDDSGDVLLVQDGTESQVSFTEDEMGLMRGRTITHNHPGGRSFSDYDVEILTRSHAKSIRAVGVNHMGYDVEYELSWDHTQNVRKGHARAQYNKALKDARENVGNLIRMGELTVDQGNDQVIHDTVLATIYRLNKAFPKAKFKYTRIYK